MSRDLSFDAQASYLLADEPMIGVQLRPGILRVNKCVHYYRVAEHNLVTDLSLSALFGFEQNCSRQEYRAVRINAQDSVADSRKIYGGLGWIGNQWREVTCWSVSGGYRIVITGIGTFWISEDGDTIICTEEESTVELDLVAQAVIGPALILALSLHNVWCLHAGAVTIEERGIAFLGESGKGKSTLVHWLNAQGGEQWQRLGDDILPVRQSPDGLHALPHFPQLKLPAQAQPARGMPEQVPLEAVYVLGRPSTGSAVDIRALGKQEGTLAMVRHTVASRLFDADLLQKHLDFCAETVTRIPLRQLIYPLTPAALPEVREAISADLRSRTEPVMEAY